MKRRQFVTFLGGVMALWPLHAPAQQQARVFRIGVLASDAPETRGPAVEVFTRAMRDLGYVEGRNVVYEVRYARGDVARLSALAAELAGLNLDVIAVPNGPSVEAAAQATEQAKRPVPIVFSGWATPLSSKLVASLARPGGNVTGVTNITIELAGKQLQLLKDAFPKISRVAVFVDLTNARLGRHYLNEVDRAAKALGMQTLAVEMKGSDDVERNLALLRKWRADSIFVANNPANSNNRKALVELAQLSRLPAIYGNDATEIGGLMSYGSDDKTRWRQIATFVDKILKGTRPGDLPIEIPTKFELVINLKTAKALGVTIPQAVLVQADRVIE